MYWNSHILFIPKIHLKFTSAINEGERVFALPSDVWSPSKLSLKYIYLLLVLEIRGKGFLLYPLVYGHLVNYP